MARRVHKSEAKAADAQRPLVFRSWGGKRAGAGRPKKRDAGVPHTMRARVARSYPLHVSLRVRGGIPSLRSRSLFPVVEEAMRGVLGRQDFRVVQFTALGNHLHLFVEADGTTALSRGVQALAIRIAKGVNRVLARNGSVFRDRYHARALRTPREVRNALCYVLQNYRRHATREGEIVDPYWMDPCSSGRSFDGWRGWKYAEAAPLAPAPVSPARTWLASTGWRRHGLVRVDEVPRAAWG